MKVILAIHAAVPNTQLVKARERKCPNRRHICGTWSGLARFKRRQRLSQRPVNALPQTKHATVKACVP
jgi:hypothetical protein